jgi:hypothetical protein
MLLRRPKTCGRKYSAIGGLANSQRILDARLLMVITRRSFFAWKSSALAAPADLLRPFSITLQEAQSRSEVRAVRSGLDNRRNRTVQHTAHGSQQIRLLQSDHPVRHYRRDNGGNVRDCSQHKFSIRLQPADDLKADPAGAAVHGPQRPDRCGGGQQRRGLRRRQRKQPGAETASAVVA